MELDFAFLAEAATVAENGIFNVLGGGFDLLRNPGPFPATKTTMILLARIKVTAKDRGSQHELLAEFVGPDGKVIPPEVRVPFVPEESPKPNSQVTFALTYHDVTFPTPGEYQFKLSVGSSPLGQINLEVIAKESGS